jgi:Raf kinase inhibitor-like YbhB/YbcL family protein
MLVSGIYLQFCGGDPMIVKSSVFSEGAMIGAKYTCDGEDVSPPLSWSGAPEQSESFALICDDPDAPAGTWVHWVFYDIPVSISELPEKISGAEKPKTGGTQGVNDFRKIGYGGPCPPGGTHRYLFKLYALDRELGIAPGASKQQVLAAMKGHVLAEAKLMGRYRR